MARPTAEERLTRLLAIIPWVVERGGATLDEIAERFDIEVSEVLKELSLVQCCEIPPYGPEKTLGIAVVDGDVLVDPAAMLDRPLRLGPHEGFGLLATGRLALAVPGADPSGALAGALEKLEAALGARAPVVVEIDRPAALDSLQAAVDGSERVVIEYYAAYRDEVAERTVDPTALVHRDGNWYLQAWCHQVEADRTFRVDRVERVERTGALHDRPAGDGPDRYVPDEDGESVVLSLPGEARWITETYPTDDVVEVGDGFEVTMIVASSVFLERLLLRAGSEARVIAPPHLAGLGSAVAGRLLERYG